jgi:hypothetical protein
MMGGLLTASHLQMQVSMLTGLVDEAESPSGK